MTPSRVRTDSIWGTFAFVPQDEPSACSASLLTICKNSSLRMHSCPRCQRVLLVFQVDGQHERITDIYVGFVVHRVDSCLYTLDRILAFVKDIEGDLKAAHNALKARGDPSKRCTFCLFVSNYGGTVSIPMDLPYCLVYPTSYVRDVEPDHFDSRNNPAGTCLHHCMCHTTLQYMNADPKLHRKYSGSCLILSCGAQYKE